MAIVYVLSRMSAIDDIRYVGMSKYDDVQVRMTMHETRKKSGHSLPVYDWMRKYDDVTATVIYSDLSREEACAAEVKLIADLRRSGFSLLNCTDGGDGMVNLSEESRKKLVAASTGRKHTDETRKKMSIAKKGKPPWNKGVPMSEQSKAKLSESKRGKKLSEEHKKKISESGKGRKHTQEARDKIGRGHRGKYVSEETRRKLSESNKGKVPWNKGMKKKNDSQRREQ
jgi:hypothetical protein